MSNGKIMCQLSKTAAENYRNGVSFVLKNSKNMLRKSRKGRNFFNDGAEQKTWHRDRYRYLRSTGLEQLDNLKRS